MKKTINREQEKQIENKILTATNKQSTLIITKNQIKLTKTINQLKQSKLIPNKNQTEQTKTINQVKQTNKSKQLPKPTTTTNIYQTRPLRIYYYWLVN